jgi:succinylglutamate desuccinylase
VSHVIQALRATAPGSTLVLVGGMHGNEPAGVEVLRRLLVGLAPRCGEVVALEGNPLALAAGVRMLDRDLNRVFVDLDAPPLAGPEHLAARALAQALRDIIARARGQVYVLDLHTTSAKGTPFCIGDDDPATQALAQAIGLPTVLGLTETITGTLGAWAASLGCAALAIEGGQHAAAASREQLAAVVTVALAATGVLPQIAGLTAAQTLLGRARGELPRRVRVVSRHAVDPLRPFCMQPGFANLHAVRAGTLLAHDGDVPVLAPADGLVIMPLYQAQGSDGFFFGLPLDATS